MAKAATRTASRAKAALAPEPAVMAAGASEENAEQGRGMPPAASPSDAAPAEEEGFRNEAGQFTGNPPTDTERLDAICDMLERNGMSLPKVLQRPKE